jgi:hypothetical protein
MLKKFASGLSGEWLYWLQLRERVGSLPNKECFPPLFPFEKFIEN